ncbi:metal-binding protein [Prochlorococcus sp. MIT 1341]|uniref:metal-binding protein n=1 Tax=Prochlorococcus sp. MIT 1341 TaxID=3096221 RepID=UPI002A75D894|nr:metal-binding protein [Prochlorococcus sp. MIT 1341]
MASGKNHDRATKLLSLPFGVAVGITLGLENGLIGGISFLVGGLWLSPDLDTNSNALKRWGFLKGIWIPYKKLICHRSLLSHGPVIGTTIRLLYLAIWLYISLAIFRQLGIIKFADINQNLFQNLLLHKEKYVAFILGLEMSAWLHLIQDGDPTMINLKK